MQSWHLRENFEQRLRTVSIFKGCSKEFISSLVMKLKPRIAQAKEIIVKQVRLAGVRRCCDVGAGGRRG